MKNRFIDRHFSLTGGHRGSVWSAVIPVCCQGRLCSWCPSYWPTRRKTATTANIKSCSHTFNSEIQRLHLLCCSYFCLPLFEGSIWGPFVQWTKEFLVSRSILFRFILVANPYQVLNSPEKMFSSGYMNWKMNITSDDSGCSSSLYRQLHNYTEFILKWDVSYAH